MYLLISNKYYFLLSHYKQVFQHNDFVIYYKDLKSTVYYYLNHIHIFVFNLLQAFISLNFLIIKKLVVKIDTTS